MKCREYGRLADGRTVYEFEIDNGLGLRLSAINYGGIVTGLWVPDGEGGSVNVTLGLPTLDDYVQHNPHFGTLVGRYGNRIAGAAFELDGQRHVLDANDGPNCLHGGRCGFGSRFWSIEPAPLRKGEAAALRLGLTSPDGDQGFPGTLHVQVRYSLSAVDRTWRVDYEAETDRPTVVNLTHHAYFNLAGAGSGSALNHRLQIHAARYSEVDAHLIPQRHAAVDGTPFDFRQPAVIDARIRQAHPQLLRAKGYDHNWLLDAPAEADGLRWAARLDDPVSGRQMEVRTQAPALQFYSGNFLDGSLSGPAGQAYRQGDGLCLETQHSPDSPHHDACDDWPTTVLRPGQVWRSATTYRFTERP